MKSDKLFRGFLAFSSTISNSLQESSEFVYFPPNFISQFQLLMKYIFKFPKLSMRDLEFSKNKLFFF